LAIVQISQITNRKGLAENLPQLAGAEFGWSTDTRQLWIGNGTLEEGAPVVGNTEILTEFSNILNFSTTYTYKGQAAGYTVQTGPTSGTPVELSLQSWLDQFASVLDFGAVGDGTTDCTAAINRALYQLYCREVNPQIRRSLFFPAGVYKVTGTINIPPYATLYGEGADNSVISLASGAAYVAQTADSLQQTGSNIGSGGTTPPQYITISNLGFQAVDSAASAFLVGQANNCRFSNVGFYGPGTTATLTSDAAGTSGVEFASTISYVCEQIVFDGCSFKGTTWASYSDQQLQGIVFANSKLDTLYTGFELGGGAPAVSGPTGIRITNNVFDNIYAEGIIFGTYCTLCASANNVFYDVGNHFDGITGPATSIVVLNNSNNVSISDMFARADSYATTYPRIYIDLAIDSVASTNGSQIVLATGSYVRQSGSQTEIANNTTATVTTVPANEVMAFAVDYTIVRDTTYRKGTMMVSSINGTGTPVWTDEFVQNADTGVTVSAVQDGDEITIIYTSDNTLGNGTINYSINYLA
jgi:Pectate lyase superfamily protein